MTKKDQTKTSTSLFQPAPDTVYNRIDQETVLVLHMRTNRIYELNQTGARFWELLCAGYDQATIHQLMLQEFDVAEADMVVETEVMLASLKNEDLITPVNGN